MTALWGIHNDQTDLDLVEGGFVAIGWDELGDLRAVGADRDRLKEHIVRTYPGVKPGAVPVWAGVILRFMAEVAVGDLVISPDKADRTLDFGRVSSGFYVEPGAEVHRNRRRVRWLQTGVPRDAFSQGARYEIGSSLTLFRVTTHAAEFLDFLGPRDGGPPKTYARRSTRGPGATDRRGST